MQADAVRAQIVHQVAHQEAERLASQAPAPERRIPDADADLGALRLRLPAAVVRETDRAPALIDDEQRALRQGEALDELSSRGRFARESTGRAAPLIPGELGVVRPAHQVRGVVGARGPQRDPLTAEDLAAQAIASPTLGSCGAKSGGSVLLSRSVATRSMNASSATPRSSSRDPRRRTETVSDAASLSPTTSM